MLNGHGESFLCLIELNNGLLASGSFRYTIRLWDLNSRQCLTCILTDSCIRCLVELNDGRLAYPCGNRSIKLLHPFSHKCVNELTSNSANASSMIKLTDGRLVSGAVDGIITIWDASCSKFNTLTENSFKVSCLVELRHGSLASASHTVIQLWNTTTYQLIKNIKLDLTVNSFAQTENGDFVYGSFFLTPFLLRQ